MSRTWKDTKQYYEELPHWRWYSAAPKWWRKMKFTRPKRRQTTYQCYLATAGIYEQTWPLGSRKPHEYYW